MLHVPSVSSALLVLVPAVVAVLLPLPTPLTTMLPMPCRSRCCTGAIESPPASSRPVLALALLCCLFSCCRCRPPWWPSGLLDLRRQALQELLSTWPSAMPWLLCSSGSLSVTNRTNRWVSSGGDRCLSTMCCCREDMLATKSSVGESCTNPILSFKSMSITGSVRVPWAADQPTGRPADWLAVRPTD